jgi:hypothetical protein
MSDNEEERRVKARLDRQMGQFYKRKRTVSQKDMPKGIMTIDDVPSPNT